jgi:R3H domain
VEQPFVCSRFFNTASSDMRKKDRHIPPELRDQWDRDRAKKAEHKHARALARTQEAIDLSSTPKSSRGKQQVLGGARFQGDTLYTDRIHDMSTLEQLIRTFLDNLDAKNMVLPPKGKEWRKRAHILADVFSLKSKSKGKGEGRFMTLIKTTRSGFGVNERKVSALVNGGNSESYHGSERARLKTTIRHRDGDEVGKMAPRLSESNIGFKLLQQMG